MNSAGDSDGPDTVEGAETSGSGGGPAMAQEESFECPRCKSQAQAIYYGPCASCREQLRAAYAGLEREVVAEAYEPKMNVTPNAVASKE